VLAYAATVQFAFVYDDTGQIVQNVLVQSWRFVPQYFHGQVWQYLFPNAPANYYRPLNMLWFRVNDAMFGLHPAGWHAAAILLHLFAVSPVYLLARRLTGRPLVAALTALFFAIHPMRHEVVAWVSGTTESLWSVLFLCAFLAYLKSRERHRVPWMAGSCLLYLAALLSKETAIVLPGVIFAHAWLYETEPLGAIRRSMGRAAKAAQIAVIYVPVACAYLAVRVRVLHGFSHSQVHVSLRTFLLTLPSVLFFYVRQWLLPLRISEFYDLPLIVHFDARHVLFPLVGLFLLAAILWGFRRSLGSREVAFASAWMVLLLLPVLDFAVFPPGELAHDRYFYLASFGAALLMALAVEKLACGPNTFGFPLGLLLFTLAILAPLTYGTVGASMYWMNDYALFNHARWIAPNNVTVRNNYAIELALRGNTATAIPLLKELLQDQPNNYLANYNYARLSYLGGDMVVARQYFERASRLDPSSPDPYLQLGLIDLRASRFDGAEGKIRRAIALRPEVPTYHFALAITLADQGKCSAARTEFDATLMLQPGFPRAQEQAQKCATPATRIDPPPKADAQPEAATLQ